MHNKVSVNDPAEYLYSLSDHSQIYRLLYNGIVVWVMLEKINRPVSVNNVQLLLGHHLKYKHYSGTYHFGRQFLEEFTDQTP